MRVRCKKEELIKNVGAVQRAVSGRSTLPILNNILVDAKGEKVRLVATDLEIGIEALLPAVVQKEGIVTFPAKYFLEIVRHLPGEEVEIYLEKGTQIHIQSEKAHFTMSGLSAEEFPLLPEIKDGTTLKIGQKDLQETIEKTTFACSKDETTRPELSGVLLLISEDKIQAVATDGNRLALKELEWKGGTTAKQELLIPSRALDELLRILPDGEEELEIIVGNNQVDFQLSSKKLITRKIQNRFPNWEQVIPKEFQMTFLVETARLQEALDRCLLLARLVNNRVRLQGEGANFVLSTSVPEVGSVEEELSWTKGEGSIDMGFNVRFLIEGVRNIKTEHTFLGYTGKERPLVLRPSDEKGFLYLAMPLRT